MIGSLLYAKITFLTLISITWLVLPAETSLSNGRNSGFNLSLLKSINEGGENSQDDQIYDVADKMPRPIGGQDAWEEYLSENLNYPLAARNSKVEGVVYVVFILEKDGRPSNVELLRGIGAGCDEEAKRLVEASPKWTPGENNGEPVRVRMRLPIRFHLPD